MLEINRRSLITGLVSFIAAPAIVRVSSIMPVKMIELDEIDEIINLGSVPNNFASLPIKNQFTVKLFIRPTAGTKGEFVQLSDWTPVTDG